MALGVPVVRRTAPLCSPAREGRAKPGRMNTLARPQGGGRINRDEHVGRSGRRGGRRAQWHWWTPRPFQPLGFGCGPREQARGNPGTQWYWECPRSRGPRHYVAGPLGPGKAGSRMNTLARPHGAGVSTEMSTLAAERRVVTLVPNGTGVPAVRRIAPFETRWLAPLLTHCDRPLHVGMYRAVVRIIASGGERRRVGRVAAQ